LRRSPPSPIETVLAKIHPLPGAFKFASKISSLSQRDRATWFNPSGDAGPHNNPRLVDGPLQGWGWSSLPARRSRTIGM